MKEDVRKPEQRLTRPEQGLSKGFFDVFNLPEPERIRLQERVKASKGLVRIFVHPFFETNPASNAAGQLDEKTDVNEHAKIMHRLHVMQKTLKKWLEQDADTTPPIFVMEELPNIPNLAGHLKTISQPLYIVPTHEKCSLPYVTSPTAQDTYLHINEEISYDYARWHWEILIKYLEELGVAKIIIGGMNLRVYMTFGKGRNDHNDKDLKPVNLDNCVGDAINNLSGSFVVETSSLAFPDARVEHQQRRGFTNKHKVYFSTKGGI